MAGTASRKKKNGFERVAQSSKSASSISKSKILTDSKTGGSVLDSNSNRPSTISGTSKLASFADKSKASGARAKEFSGITLPPRSILAPQKSVIFPSFIEAKVSKKHVHVTNQSAIGGPTMASALKNRTLGQMSSLSNPDSILYGGKTSNSCVDKRLMRDQEHRRRRLLCLTLLSIFSGIVLILFVLFIMGIFERKVDQLTRYNTSSVGAVDLTTTFKSIYRTSSELTTTAHVTSEFSSEITSTLLTSTIESSIISNSTTVSIPTVANTTTAEEATTSLKLETSTVHPNTTTVLPTTLLNITSPDSTLHNVTTPKITRHNSTLLNTTTSKLNDTTTMDPIAQLINATSTTDSSVNMTTLEGLVEPSNSTSQKLEVTEAVKPPEKKKEKNAVRKPPAKEDKDKNVGRNPADTKVIDQNIVKDPSLQIA